MTTEAAMDGWSVQIQTHSMPMAIPISINSPTVSFAQKVVGVILTFTLASPGLNRIENDIA